MNYFVLSNDGSSKTNFTNIVICSGEKVAKKEAANCKDKYVVLKNGNYLEVIKG